MGLEFKKTKTNNMKQLLYFSAPWCQPCKQFKPLMESLQSEMSITFIDVEISSQTTIQNNVLYVPTTILIENGMDTIEAIEMIRRHRNGALNSKQIDYLIRFKKTETNSYSCLIN